LNLRSTLEHRVDLRGYARFQTGGSRRLCHSRNVRQFAVSVNAATGAALTESKRQVAARPKCYLCLRTGVTHVPGCTPAQADVQAA
jgi:hypothetical protein